MTADTPFGPMDVFSSDGQVHRTQGLSFETKGRFVQPKGLPAEPKDLAVEPKALSVETKDLPVESSSVSVKPKGVPDEAPDEADEPSGIRAKPSGVAKEARFSTADCSAPALSGESSDPGNSEAAGTGIEVLLRARVQVDLLKKKSLRWPRFESDQKLMTVGAYRPLDDALRIALSELVAWIHADYGLIGVVVIEELPGILQL